MKKDDIGIEDLFKDSFDSYEVKPEPQTWNKISKKMFVRQFMKFKLNKFNLYYLTAILAIVTGVGVVLLKIDSEKHKISKIDKLQTIPADKIRRVFQNDSEQSADFVEIKKKGYSSKKLLAGSGKKINAIFNKEFEIEPVETVAGNYKNNIALDRTHKNSDLEKLKSTPPQPLFEVDVREGCAPLKVRILNYTKYAQSYEWSFGNGEKSEEVNPVHTYNEPGTYTITLKAKSLGGTAVSFVDSIVVHNRLVNKTDHSFKDQIAENEEFSVNADGRKFVEYKWCFGDGHISNKKQAKHSYKKEGTYSISLISRNNENCYDSVVVTEVKVVKSSNKLLFPNAFCPNVSGPPSKKYVQNSTDNDIFYPLIVGTLTKYHIKIYAKTGILLFETKDVNIGWNGYYKNKLVSEGVYPYIVTAHFEGDNRAVQKSGNITVLHRKR